MKITWNFADGTKSEVEVNEEIGTIIFDSRKAEHAQQEKQRYHCYSLDAIEFEGTEYADKMNTESRFEAQEDGKLLLLALDTLTAVQKRRLYMFAEGLSLREIARREGTDYKQIKKSTEAARKKIKNFFRNRDLKTALFSAYSEGQQINPSEGDAER